jgi:uncharacterized protein
MIACSLRDVDIVKELINRGAVVNYVSLEGRETPLMKAASFGSIDIVKLLIDNSAEINQQRVDGVTALMLAVRAANPEKTKILLNAGAKKDIKTNGGSTVEDMNEYYNIIHTEALEEIRQLLKD